MKAFILAGGKGARLTDVTNDIIPKPMVPLLGKPLIEHQIEQLKNFGITDIDVSLGHLGHVIQGYFNDGAEFGVNLLYHWETSPLGTGGALRALNASDGDCLLVYGDLLFDVDLPRMFAFHQQRKALATVFAHPNAHPHDSDSLIIGKDSYISGINFKNKKWHNGGPEHDAANIACAGLYIISPNLLRYVPQTAPCSFEKDVLLEAIKFGEKVAAYQSSEFVMDIGTKDRLMAAENALRRNIPAKRNMRNKPCAVFFDRVGNGMEE
jgi:NDP-sugar pyrophosphorylase family protein